MCFPGILTISLGETKLLCSADDETRVNEGEGLDQGHGVNRGHLGRFQLTFLILTPKNFPSRSKHGINYTASFSPSSPSLPATTGLCHPEITPGCSTANDSSEADPLFHRD